MKLGSTKFFLVIGIIAIYVCTYFFDWQKKSFYLSDKRFQDFDDTALILNNPYVNQGFTKDGLNWAFLFKQVPDKNLIHAGASNVWAPLSFVSHMLDFQVWGKAKEFNATDNYDASGHFLTNIVLHLTSAILLLQLFSLLGKRFFRSSELGFWFGFAVFGIFCLHPLRVESVAWLSERKGVLSGLFFHASLLAYVIYLKSLDEKKLAIKSKYYLLCFLLFILGLMSKPTIVILPFILLLIDWQPYDRFTDYTSQAEESFIKIFFKRAFLEKIPFFCASIFIVGLNAFFQYAGSHKYFAKQHSSIQAIKELPALLLSYLEHFFYPINLYPHYPRFSHGSFAIYTSIAILMLIGFLAIIKKFSRTNNSPIFGLVWFVICIVPTMGLFYVGNSFGADRYVYLATSGLIFSLISLFCLLPRELSFLNNVNQKILIALVKAGKTTLVFALLLLAYLSNRQVSHWQNSQSIFFYGVKAQPKSYLAWVNLGTYYYRTNKKPLQVKALDCFKKSFELKPNHIAYYNYATTLSVLEHPDSEQEKYLLKTLEILPRYQPALYKLAKLYYNPYSKVYHIEKAKKYFLETCEATGFQIREPIQTLAEICAKTKDVELLQKLEKLGVLKTRTNFEDLLRY